MNSYAQTWASNPFSRNKQCLSANSFSKRIRQGVIFLYKMADLKKNYSHCFQQFQKGAKKHDIILGILQRESALFLNSLKLEKLFFVSFHQFTNSSLMRLLIFFHSIFHPIWIHSICKSGSSKECLDSSKAQWGFFQTKE